MAVGSSGGAALPYARYHRLDQMTLAGLRALNRARTVALLPVGMIEQHGSHLPLGTDNFSVEALTLATAAHLLEADAGLHVLVLPTIPYGTDPVDLRRPELFQAAGSVWISRDTLKQVVAEVCGHLVRYGFRHIFPLGYHGGADQSRALAEVCAEMRARHPGLVMVEPLGYVLAGAAADISPGVATLLGRPLTTQEQIALRGSIHAGMYETSVMLALRPDLVSPAYRTLPSIEANEMVTMPDWPGYVGAGPSHANAEVGAAVLRWRGIRAAVLIRRALAGEDITRLPRHPRSEPNSSLDFIDTQPDEVPSPDLDALDRARQAGPAED
ncbi:MAG: hypothetical protein Kow00124_18350 [Anaerolineae bacterium]